MNEPMREMTQDEKDTREAGIRAIIALQAWAGITETRAEAEAGWDAMSDSEKDQTMHAYSVIGG